ncbi:AfsA-related hotdog domain-containing protein [Streptomyces sp. NPDC050759]|uniref:AfsA-related hotdog domain-containing protein n=1 Tax=Streptomyces sp. NPDC050759 TaxID=3365635 RepID=UPI0037B73125
MEDLSFQQTVDRVLVHRHAVNEVFLTDLVPIDRDTCVIGAQLPLSHPYFLDQRAPTARYDALLLTECCRQAGTYVAHTQYGVARDWVFLAAATSIELERTDVLEVGDSPGELTLEVHSRPSFRGGRLRSVRTRLDLSMAGERIGVMEGEGRYLDREEYGLLRQGGRGGQVPLSSALGVEPAGVPVAPRLVERRDPRNVLLVDAHGTTEGVAARLWVSGRHATIFDHPLDHYPAMALLEAAAQATTLAVRLDGASSGRADGAFAARTDGADVRITGLAADYVRFAEVDADVDITATITERPPAAGHGPLAANVVFRQRGAVLTEIAVSAELHATDRTPARQAVAA